MRPTGYLGARIASLALLASLLLSLGPVAMVAGAQAVGDPRLGPYIDRITMPVQRDYNLRLLAFEAGDFDLVGVLPRDIDRVRTNRPDANLIFTVSITSLGSVHFNVQNWPVNYSEVRKALAHIINRDVIISQSPLQGVAIKDPYIVPPTYGKWVNPNTDFEKIYPYDKAKARQLLSTIFVPCASDPSMWCDPRAGGKQVEIELLTLPEATSPVYWWEALYLQREAKDIGIKINIVPVSSRELDARTAAGTAVAYIIGWSFGRFPLFMYYFWHSREIRPGGWNEWKVSNATLDDLLDKFYYAGSPDEAMQYAWKAQEILTDIIPWIPVYTGVGITAFSGKVDKNSILLVYAPPLKDPVGLSYFWWNTVRFVNQPLGGTLRYHFTVDITTLNPSVYLWVSEADAIFRVYTFGYVVRPEDIYAEPRIPVLFTNYKVDRGVVLDGRNLTRITLWVNNNAKWHDGVPITAGDVAFTLKKFGMELKTRRYYGPYIDALYRINVVNDTVVELYFTQIGWPDIYSMTEMAPLPAHIYGKLANPLDDVSLLPHPSIAGLTAMIGNGPFVMVKREIAYAELQWYPEYLYKPQIRSLRVEPVQTIQQPLSLRAGDTLGLSFRVSDWLGSPVDNATVTARIVGTSADLEARLVSVGNGIYRGTTPQLPPGDLVITVTASMPVGTPGSGSTGVWRVYGQYQFRATASGAGVQAPGEARPVEISVGGVTIAVSSPAAPTSTSAVQTRPSIQAPPTQAVGADVTTSYIAMALSVLSIVAVAVLIFVRR